MHFRHGLCWRSAGVGLSAASAANAPRQMDRVAAAVDMRSRERRAADVSKVLRAPSHLERDACCCALHGCTTDQLGIRCRFALSPSHRAASERDAASRGGALPMQCLQQYPEDRCCRQRNELIGQCVMNKAARAFQGRVVQNRWHSQPPTPGNVRGWRPLKGPVDRPSSAVDRQEPRRYLVQLVRAPDGKVQAVQIEVEPRSSRMVQPHHDDRRCRSSSGSATGSRTHCCDGYNRSPVVRPPNAQRSLAGLRLDHSPIRQRKAGAARTAAWPASADPFERTPYKLPQKNNLGVGTTCPSWRSSSSTKGPVAKTAT